MSSSVFFLRFPEKLIPALGTRCRPVFLLPSVSGETNSGNHTPHLKSHGCKMSQRGKGTHRSRPKTFCPKKKFSSLRDWIWSDFYELAKTRWLLWPGLLRVSTYFPSVSGEANSGNHTPHLIGLVPDVVQCFYCPRFPEKLIPAITCLTWWAWYQTSSSVSIALGFRRS